MQKFKSNLKIDTSLMLFKQQKCLLANISTINQFYFTIPLNAVTKKIKTKLIILSSIFLYKVENILKNIVFGIKKKLVLNGLGFKIWNSSSQDKKISLKLGYSHLVYLKIPNSTISFSFFKIKRMSGVLFLIIKGNDLQEIGNFTRKLKNLKKYDVYKGKGFSDKKLKLKLKMFKKK